MAKAKKEIIDNSKLYDENVENVLHSSMIPYSEHVIMDRAIPRVEDGLKPVHRRILYTLYDLGITPDKPHKKSARIVGDCLGKYHPHGDSSVYDAMVRLAQGFSMRMPLVDGHGNFGSADGDSAAAMRYTEVRMSPLALSMLRDLEKDTVSWSWNFDDTLKEPDLLPGRFPNLLVNGTQGIAIGLSSNIPTHNLGESIDAVVALIDNPRISLDEIMKIIPGPDFPTGGYIITEDNLRQAYETGKGKIILKAKIHIEDADNDKKNIVITELPYQVKMSDVLRKLLLLRETRKEIFGGIQDILDETDRNGTRAVIKVRREVDAEKLVPLIYKMTDLQKSFPINMVAIADGKPRQLSLIELLKYYLAHQVNIIVNRTKFDLKAAKHRAEIVKGLLIAIRNIDEVIRIIKGSPTTAVAKQTLRERFELSDEQAQAILDMRLRALTNLEVGNLEEELADLEKKIEYYTLVLSSKKEQYKIIRSEILEIKKQNKSPRRSVILHDDITSVSVKTNEIEYKECILVHNINGTMKTVTAKNFSMSQTDISSCDYDLIADNALYINNRQAIYAFSNLGNCFRLTADDFPDKKWRERGKRLPELCKDAVVDERLVSLFAFDVDPVGEVLLMSAKGMMKRTSWSELVVSKSAYKVMKLDEDDRLMSVQEVNRPIIFEATENGIYLAFAVSEVPVQGRAAGGVKSIQLGENDSLVTVSQMKDDDTVVLLSSEGKGKKVFVSTLDVSRGRTLKGMKLFELDKNEKLVYAGLFADDVNLAVVTDKGVVDVDTAVVPFGTRTTAGRTVLRSKVERVVLHCSSYTKK